MKPRESLSRSEEEVLLAVADALVREESAQGPAFPPAGESGCAGRLAALVESLPGDRRRLLRLGCRVVGLRSRLRSFRPVSALRPEEVLQLLAGLDRSPLKPLRRLSHTLRMLAAYAYFCGEAAWPMSGYDGPWLGRVNVDAEPPPQIFPGGSA